MENSIYTTNNSNSFNITNDLIVIDTSDNRIGVNTIEPGYSIDVRDLSDVSGIIYTEYLKTGAIISNLTPCIDVCYNLGSQDNKWNEIHTNYLDVSKINLKNQSNQNRYFIGLSNDHLVIKDIINDFSVLEADNNTQQVTIPGLARTSDVYSKDYIDSSLNLKANTSDIPTDFYSTSYIDTSFSSVETRLDTLDTSINNIGGGGGGGFDATNKQLAIGYNAGLTNQDISAIAIGNHAGNTDQSYNSIAIGEEAGSSYQKEKSLAIGFQSGMTSQQHQSIAIGYQSGMTSQSHSSIAIGYLSGRTSQSHSSLAIGKEAGNNSQGQLCIAIGGAAGNNSQQDEAIAIGKNAGKSNQNDKAIAIGSYAGSNNQGQGSIGIGVFAGQSQDRQCVAIGGNAGVSSNSYSVAIGNLAAQGNQGEGAIAIGYKSSQQNQGQRGVSIGYNSNSRGVNTVAIGNAAGNQGGGNYSIAIGNRAGQNDLCNNSIILNADYDQLNSDASGFYVNPIRNVEGIQNQLFYDVSKNEIVYAEGSSISTTGAQDLDILTYKSSTNSIVWSSANINLKNFITQSATPQLYGTFFGTEAGDHIGGVDITANGDYIVIGYYEAKQSTDASTDTRGLVRVFKSTDKATDTWEQVGGNIYGSTTTSQIGKQVVIAHDNPNRIAIREENPACVRVYEYSGGSWNINSTVTGYAGTTFLVANFDPSSSGDNNIHAVCLSNDGNRLVMSDLTNGGVGKLVVYDYISSSSTWTPTNIVHPYGVTENDRYGFAVAMSGDGNRIITSFPANRDLVRIVDYINGSWSWTSHTFSGASGSKTGFSVAISSDGTTIAYVQPEITVSNVANVGRVLVYRETAGTFVGEATLNGTQQHGRLGHRFWDGNSGNATSVPSGWESEMRSYFSSLLALNNNGRRLAVGSWFFDNSSQERGIIKIYDKSPTTNAWSVSGSGTSQSNTFIDILGDNETNGYFGASLAMADDGNHIAGVGAYDDNTAGVDSGIVKTYILPDALTSGTVFYGTDNVLRIVP